jgi:AI-2 transport protein TqsA
MTTPVDEPSAPLPEEPEDKEGAGRIKTAYQGILGRPVGLLLTLACVTIILYGMRYARAILAPILLALFIVMGLSPVLQWLRRKGLPPWAAIVIVMIGFLVVALLLTGIIAESLGEVYAKVPEYQENLATMLSSVQSWFEERGIEVGGLTGDVLRPDRIIGWVTSSIRMLISLLTDAALLILVTAFMIAEAYSFKNKMRLVPQLGPRLGPAFENFATVTRTYLFTLAWLNLLTAILVAVVYYAFGVDFALLWTLIFFLLSFIPNIGFVLSVIPPFFVTLFEFGFTRAATVVLVVIIFNAFVNNIVAPRFMGHKTDPPTLMVSLSLVLWAWVLGPSVR